jgi:Ca2+-binding RTX toxin-like protein
MTYFNARGVAMPESRVESGRLVGTGAGNETITAGSGDISLSGEGGGDLLVGSSGDNHIFITSPLDRVQEAVGGGVDTMIGWLSLKLAPNVENLVVHQDFNFRGRQRPGQPDHR